jgi:acetylornithine/N-succinyldiaminopimelate aminotransferase
MGIWFCAWNGALVSTTRTVEAGFQPASRAASLPPAAIGLDARMRPSLADWKLASTVVLARSAPWNGPCSCGKRSWPVALAGANLKNMNSHLDLASALGPRGPRILAAMQAGLHFLDSSTPTRLLARVGSRVSEVPAFKPIDKSVLQDSYGGNQTGPSDDFLVGRGLFYLSEQRRLFLDCTSGHYQMLWGYNHPELCAAVEAATRAGVVWDNHSNIPQSPLKQLARRLLAVANSPRQPDPLDTALLGVCTGSVACAAALKIQLKVFARDRGKKLVPVIVVLDGSYHGTDMVAQSLRGMWPGLVKRCDVVKVQANDAEELTTAFRKYGARIAGFWAEPILMNREAIAVNPEYLKLARQCCDRVGALMCIDEIQTCFWRPEIFDARAFDLRPDLLVLGKGMTAGFHPLSGVLLKHRHDVLEQYDAISTNGSAALPAFVTLCSMALLAEHAPQIRKTARRIEAGFRALVAEFPDQLETAQGRGHLAGLKFKRVEAAKAFHRRLLEAGLWTRAHAYHEGHRTILTKLGMLADETVTDFVLARFRELLKPL